MSLYPIASQSLRLRTVTASRPSLLIGTPHRAHPLHHRLYSTPPQPKNRSQFPILPILALIAVSSGSYVFLVRSRTGLQTPQRNHPRPSDEQ